VPLTTRDRDLPIHVRLTPPEGGLLRPSVILCDQLRIAGHERLERKLGRVSPTTLAAVGKVVRRILGL
jgi:mRNA interferase MazF